MDTVQGFGSARISINKKTFCNKEFVMKKRLLSAALALMLVFCFVVGCANTGTVGETETRAETQVTTETQGATETETRVETQVVTETQTVTETEPEIEPESEVETKAETEVEIETEADTELESEVESAFESDTETETETEGANVTLRLGVMSDTHLGANVGSNMDYALQALKGVSGDRLDMMLFSGDLTDTTGSTVVNDQIKAFRAKYNREMKGTPFVFCLGSTHDLPAMSGSTRPTTLETIRGLYKDTLGNFDYDLSADTYADTGIRHAVMNGYHIFAIDYLPTEEALADMVTEMETLTAEDADKPIFVILHNPAETHITSLFAEFPQVICFSGHYHNSSAREDSIKQDGGYTQVHIGGTAYYRVDGYNRFNTADPFLNLGNIYKFAQSLYVEVDEENTVTIYRVDGYTGETFGEPWVINPDRRDVYTNERKETAKPCTFPEDAKIDVYEGSTAVQVDFDGATMGDAGPALYYNISLLEKNSQGQYVMTQSADVGSQQVFYPNDEGIPAGHYTHTFRGVNVSDYAIVIRAVDCWQTSTSVLVHSTGGYQHGHGNVALGKRVTVTAGGTLENDQNGLAAMTDGRFGWYANQPGGLRTWTKPTEFIPSEENPLDIVIDLGDTYEIEKIVLHPSTSYVNVFPTYFEYQVSMSEDGDDWQTIHVIEDVICNGRLSSSAPFEDYDPDNHYDVELEVPATARRFRIHITTPSPAWEGDTVNYMGFGEIELWGKPAED